MADKKPWEIAEEDEEDVNLDEAFKAPHPADAAKAERQAAISEMPPAVTKSEKTARDLGYFDLKAGFGTVAKIGYDMGQEAVGGLAGLAGLAGGMWPGGESPNEKGGRYLSATRDFVPEWNPQDSGIQAGQEMVGRGMGRVVEEVKKTGSPAAYAGARLSGASPEEASLSMQDFMAEENALGEGVFRATESPTMAVVAQLLPELASMGVPAGRVKNRPRPRPERQMAPDMPEPGFGGIGEPEIRPRPSNAPIDESVINRLRAAVEAGDKQAMLDLINANPGIVAAFEQLGIEFTPGMVSDSMPIRQTEAALGSMADSNVPTMHRGVQSELAEKARQLIDDSGGDFDSPSTTAEAIGSKMDELHGDYLKAEEVIWDDLNTKIPRGAEIDMQSAAATLEETAARLGKGDVDLGISRMSKHERELWNLTHQKKKVPDPTGEPGATVDAWVYEPPPWEAVDRFRRRLGLGLNNRGPFTDAELGELQRWYGQTAEQQTRFAKGNNYAGDWERMNALTQERKALEDAMRRSTGAGSFNQSVLTKLKSATNSLIRDGDPKKWDQFMADIPADQRAAAAAQSLQQVLFPAGKGTKMTAAVADNFKKIKNDPQIRDRLLDPLPVEARAQFMALGEAVTGFYRMMDRALSNPSGTAGTRYVLERLQDPSFMQKVLGGTADRATGRLPMLGEWVQVAMRRTPDQKAGVAAERLNAAANMLTDPALRRAIVEYAAGNIEAANKILKDSQSWAAWAKTQPMPFRQRLNSMGIVALFEEESNE